MTGAGPISYQWRRNGIAISGATAASYTTPPLTIAADNGAAFSVVATNALGTATSTAATLTVTTPPPPPAATHRHRAVAAEVGVLRRYGRSCCCLRWVLPRPSVAAKLGQ